jgi:dTMP kinase
LVETLRAAGVDAELWRYPDRTTAMGKMIDAYLQSKTDMDDGAIHLLFSANRWEKRQAMEAKLESGTTLVVDRYSYSGVAFTAAKGVPGLDLEWCKAPERGLLRPDCVLYLNLPVDQAEKRGGFGEERYETTELQKNVRANFEALTEDWWTTVDATGSVEEVAATCERVAKDAVDRCRGGAAFARLWQ